MSDDLVQRTDHGAVAVLTLNRPQALNSFTRTMRAQLLPALDAAAADEQGALRRHHRRQAGF